MTQQTKQEKTRVRIEIRGRIADRATFDAICAAGDADLGASKGEFARIILEAIKDGRSPVITGGCVDGKPLRLASVAMEAGIPLVVIVGYEKGKSQGHIYCVNQRNGIMPSLPMGESGPMVPQELIQKMYKANPIHGLAEMCRALRQYDADSYPELTMPRALQVQLMPEEKIGIFAGFRR